MTVEQLEVLNDLRKRYNQAEEILDVLASAHHKDNRLASAVCKDEDIVGVRTSAVLDDELCRRLVEVTRAYSNELHTKFHNIRCEAIINETGDFSALNSEAYWNEDEVVGEVTEAIGDSDD